ncbi:MAG: SagB/ThcOx family dehydrogenase [Anaerolineaceae bacterium]
MVASIGQEFMRRTGYAEISPSPQESGIIPQPPLELLAPENAELISLPSPAKIEVPAMDLRVAIEGRRSLRKYLAASLSIDELTYLLWVSQGVKRVSSRPSTARTVPSAGARHAFETYLLVNRVEGLTPGLYRYLAIENQLVRFEANEQINALITSACRDQSQVATSAVTFMWVAVVERMFWRYVERGYRYLFLDAGHVCQNLALGAESVGCGICPIAAYDDDQLNQVLGLDGKDQFVIYLASLGKK